MPRPLILVTNDDGIASPGLRAAVQAVLGLGDILVAAPASQQTAMGRSLTGRRDACFEAVAFNVEGVSIQAHCLEASPATVVRHALQALCLDRRPDMVVSGINYGENVGTSVSASGTVGAAIEAAVLGIPALACSLQTEPAHFHHHPERDWTTAIHFVRCFARCLLSTPLPPDVDLLKLDVPATATLETPWRLCRLSRQPYFTVTLDIPHPASRLGEGRILVTMDPHTLEPDSDVRAIGVDQVVALTPLSLDATSRTDFPTLLAALG